MRRFVNGYLPVGHVGGIAIRVHWATPIGAILVGRLEFRPLDWVLFAAIILIHELSHAAAARALGVEVYSADLMPWGGQCLTARPRTETRAGLIAAAGPASHVVMLALATVLLRVGQGHLGPRLHELVDALAIANAVLLIVNLIPVPPLDGALTWKLVWKFAGLCVTGGWNAVADAIEFVRTAPERRRRARRLADSILRSLKTGTDDDRTGSGP